MVNALEIKNLVKDYGSLRAVDHVSFNVKAGEIFGLLGPNGAGKTSIISSIVTLEKPTSGEVLVFGKNVSQFGREAKSMIGFVPQELVNHGFFNIEEILHFHAGYYGLSVSKEKREYLLKKLGLYEHRAKRVKQLSGGMKRRLLVAKALIHDPKILLLDEPTAGVDIELRESLWKFVEELKAMGITLLLTTHYLEEAESLCDRVGIIDKGVLKRIGPTKELIQDLTLRTVIIRMIETPPIKSEYLIFQDKDEVQFKIPSKMQLGELMEALPINIKNIIDLKIQEGRLEDAFLSVLGESGNAK